MNYQQFTYENVKKKSESYYEGSTSQDPFFVLNNILSGQGVGSTENFSSFILQCQTLGGNYQVTVTFL